MSCSTKISFLGPDGPFFLTAFVTWVKKINKWLSNLMDKTVEIVYTLLGHIQFEGLEG